MVELLMVAVRTRGDEAEAETVLVKCLQLSMSVAFERDVCLATKASSDSEGTHTSRDSELLTALVCTLELMPHVNISQVIHAA